MKRAIKVLSIIFVLCVLTFTVSACNNKPCAHVAYGDGVCVRCGETIFIPTIIYNVNEYGTAEVCNYYGNEENLIVADTYMDKPVTAVADEAFRYNNKIKTIVLPESIKTIGEWAFSECENLESVNIPSSVTKIHDGAFSKSNKIASIEIPNGVIEIGKNAFNQCKNIDEIKLPASLLTIEDGAFTGNPQLKISVDEQNNPYCVVDNILYNKEMSKVICGGKISSDISFPKAVTNIGDYAFSENENLKKLSFKGKVKIGDLAFYGCENLKQVYFYSIDKCTFGSASFNNTDIEDVYIPYNLADYYSGKLPVPFDRCKYFDITITLIQDGEIINTIETFYGATLLVPN